MKNARILLPLLLAAPAAALLAGGCGSTSPSNPTPTNTAQPGTAIIAGRLVKAATPLSGKSIALWNYNTGAQFASSPATTDGSGNYSFSGVPINASGSDQWYVKWFTSDPNGVVPSSGPTPDWTQFALVQTRAFSVSSSTTYSVPDLDTGTQSLTHSFPADQTITTLAGAYFNWNATTQTNNGYGWRIDSATDFATNLCSIPSSGWTPNMLTTGTITASNCPGLTAATGTTRFWRIAIEESTVGGITVVASTKYWRVTLQ